MKITWLSSAKNQSPTPPSNAVDSNSRNKIETSIERWPLVVRGIARRRIGTDLGVGDTVERIIKRFGGDGFKWIMKRLGIECGCEDRKSLLNKLFPYKSET